MDVVHRLGAASKLNKKTGELVYIAVLAEVRLESGIPFHVKQARAFGATRKEVLGAVLVELPAIGNGVLSSLPIALQAFDEERTHSKAKTCTEPWLTAGGTTMKPSRVLYLPLFAAAAMMLALAAGCSTEDSIVNPDQVVGSGRLVSQDRTVGAFTGIRVTGIANVVVQEDPVQALRIEADDNILDRITTTVQGGLLTIGLQSGSYSNITVNVYASMETIKRLEVSGSANFSTATPMHTDSLTCRITGAGNMTIQGSASAAVFEITGAGAIQAFAMTLERGWSIISGTGAIETTVSRQLTASITGVGSITYAGNPSTVNQTITGVGSVKPRP